MQLHSKRKKRWLPKNPDGTYVLVKYKLQSINYAAVAGQQSA